MKVDMSPQAVTMRLKQTSDLRDLCIALGGDRLRKRMKKEMPKTHNKQANKKENKS